MSQPIDKKTISKIKKWYVDVKLKEIHAKKSYYEYFKQTIIIAIVKCVRINGNKTHLILDILYKGNKINKNKQSHDFNGVSNLRYGDLIVITDNLMAIDSFNKNGDRIGMFETNFDIENDGGGTDWDEINRLLDRQN